MEWKPSPLFPDYDVSENGDIRRNTLSQGGPVGRILRPFIRSDGYPMYMLRRNGETVHVKSHQLVATAFIGSKPFEGAEIAHNDGNPANNHFSNLRWDSRSGNHKDKVLHGTHSRGIRHPRHKLTDEAVLDMRMRYGARTVTLKRLAGEFGVSATIVGRVVSGMTWAHLPGAVPMNDRRFRTPSA